jgi:hypothetical protein
MTNELHVQRFLRTGGTLADLLERYAITAKEHPAFPGLYLLKYNQIASDFAEPIVRECRGIILDSRGKWRVVARGFDKFFNHGEPNAAALDWSTARYLEKLDGSLCLVFHHADEWHVATTGTPDAGGDINGSGLRFSDYFWQTFGTEPGGFECSKSGLCFMFELMGPANRVVVQHPEPRLVLLGARVRESGEELTAEHARVYIDNDREIETVRAFPLTNMVDVAASFVTMSPLAQEGYVVVDKAFNRVKVKHPGYVALHHAKDGLSQRAFVEIARSGEVPEVVTAFPELKPSLDEARERFDVLVRDVEADYARIRDRQTQKDFALEAVKTRCSGALFAVRAGKAPSVRDYFAAANLDQVMRLLGYKDAPAATAQ